MECDEITGCIKNPSSISTHALTWSATYYYHSILLMIVISTHALTWSATYLLPGNQYLLCISTHALTWSATGVSIVKVALHVRALWKCTAKTIVISTHALTWSATPTRKPAKCAWWISTHALTWSATRIFNADIVTPPFQLTHSRGVRLSDTIPNVSGLDFNSRTHVECDIYKIHCR